MLTYKNVVVAENSGKVFMCKLDDGLEIPLQVHDTCDSDVIDMVLFEYDSHEDTYYREGNISAILYEMYFEDEEDEDEEYEHGVNVDLEALKPFTTSVSNVYSYNSLEELDLIIKSLDEPIVDGVGCSWEKDYKNDLNKHYGLVFLWSEYDDFSCGNPFTPYCKIIDGGSVQ